MKFDNIPSALVDKVEAELLEEEEVLWIGRPESGMTAIRSSLLATTAPIALVAAIMALVSGAVLVMAGSEAEEIPWIAFALPVLIVGLVMCGQLLAHLFSATRSTYAITDHRVLILTGNSVKSFGPEDIEFIERKMQGDDVGDILFTTQVTSHSSQYGKQIQSTAVGFKGIANVRAVEALMLRTFRDRDNQHAKRKNRLKVEDAEDKADGEIAYYDSSSQQASR
ncbi:hypothetical protein G4Y79_08645 [Phototrophicus methaneseepsis]|uniref:DUF304 domain-containing protein n=1 Tax=Phototrophicus methaneseepsis TaxID=2710758 RepID=A0A7S8ECH6_9CHLR|nr:hypothetical protein [Phototrophicus methaneseepsis]QPC84426.1 hypothetical protein G4Y79_08645 [Phototrophicus methaneseepsis]